MTDYRVSPIGYVSVDGSGTTLHIDKEYLPALQALEGFSHIQVIYWFSDLDSEEARSVLEVPKPYRHAPEVMGIFATRSPVRPNPLALSAAEVLGIDYDAGVIRVSYIDAHDGSPVLDIKPYTPSIDRVEHPQVPGWCSHWPMSVETSGDFAWEEEMLF